MSVACGAITARQAEPMGDDAPSGPDFAKEARAWFVQFAGTLPFTVPVCARSAFLPPLALFACFRFVDLAFFAFPGFPFVFKHIFCDFSGFCKSADDDMFQENPCKTLGWAHKK